MLHFENGYVAPAVFPLADMLKQTIGQADEIICGKVICPICVKQPVRDCVCQFYRELSGVYGRVVPAKYKPFLLCNLRPSECSRLPLAQQTALYDELRSNPDSGWAFFAPAGYSKTTCSYALWKRAVFVNLKRSWELFPRADLGAYEFIVHTGYRQDAPSPRIPRTYVWRKSVPDLLQQHFDRMNMGEGEDATFVPKPDISVENIEKAVRLGIRPRVFLEEIDKIKPSEYTVNQLFRIFDALDRHKGQIVLDTNFSKQQFQNVFGDMIVRRIKENCIVKEFGFND